MVSRHSPIQTEPAPERQPENASPENDEPGSFLWLTSRDQWLTVIVSILVVVLLTEKWQRLRYIDRSEIQVHRAGDDIGYQIELNSATWVELTQLRDIGNVIAQRIVEDRNLHGPFQSVDDLERVKGIGPRTIEKNRRWLRVETVTLAAD